MYYDKECFCCVLGEWIPAHYATVAHIVPYSFNSMKLGYLFGEQESSPLAIGSNGPVMHQSIEQAFDDGVFAIVPDSPLDAETIEYRIVLLDPAYTNGKVVWEGPWKRKDVDGKRLTFQNPRGDAVTARPARRFLYLRYCLAIMYALERNFSRKLPPGEIWASLNKPCGYVRKSTLRLLA